MTLNGCNAEGRSDCLAERLLGAVARLVLVYPLLSINSQFGQTVQSTLWPAMGTPYEGALIGTIAGLVIGFSLWRSAIEREGWRAALADATLVLLTALWLLAVAAGMAGRIGPAALTVPWAACVVICGAIAALLRV